MDKMDRQAIETTFDGRSQVCDVTKIGQETSSATSRARNERLNCVLMLSSGRKNSQQIVFSVRF